MVQRAQLTGVHLSQTANQITTIAKETTQHSQHEQRSIDEVAEATQAMNQISQEVKQTALDALALQSGRKSVSSKALALHSNPEAFASEMCVLKLANGPAQGG